MALVLGIAAFLLLSTALALLARRKYLQKKRREMDLQVEEARKALLELRDLVATDGWKRLEKIAKAQIEGRRNEILLQPTENVMQQEYKKGEAQGIQLFMSFPTLMIEENKAVLEVAKKLEEEGS